MLHACLCTICFVFCYTSSRFYVFSETSLLTRCHSASSCFLLFLCFRKATQKVFSELHKIKVEVPIFPDTRRSPKQRWGGARASHTMGWCGLAPGHATRWWGHLAYLLMPPFRLYILLGEKTLRVCLVARMTWDWLSLPIHADLTQSYTEIFVTCLVARLCWDVLTWEFVW
jgi:hypothetical protein